MIIKATKDLVIAFLHCNSIQKFRFEGNNFDKVSKGFFEFLFFHLMFHDISPSLKGNVKYFRTLLGYMKEVTKSKSVYVQNISKTKNLDLNCLDLQSTDTQ